MKLVGMKPLGLKPLGMKLFGFLNLRGISGQIAALVIVSIAAIHLIITAAFLMHRVEPPVDGGPAELVAAVRLLGAAPASRRPLLSADIARAFPQLEIENLAPGPAPTIGEPQGFELHVLHRHLGPGYRIFAPGPSRDTSRIGIVLPDGAMISGKLTAVDRRPFWGGPWMMTLLFAVISVTLLGCGPLAH